MLKECCQLCCLVSSFGMAEGLNAQSWTVGIEVTASSLVVFIN